MHSPCSSNNFQFSLPLLHVGNSQDNCYPTKNTSVQEIGYKNYLQFIWVFFVSILGASCVLHIASFGYGEYQKRGRQAVLTNSSDEESRGDKDRDKKYALETVGLDSVYMFFVTNSIWGWLVALATMAVQLGILFIFLEGAEFDLSDDLSDWVSLVCLYFLFVRLERSAIVSTHFLDFLQMLT